MTTRRNRGENPKLNEAIDDILDDLSDYPAFDDDYAKRVEQLEKLHKIRQEMKPDGVDLNTLLVVAGNVAIALVVVGFEQKNVVTTKVLGFLAKLR